MKPLADLSYIDILPKLRENYNNFSSYIDSNHILVRFSGRFLIFHNNGTYMGQVVFEKMEPAFKQEQLKIVCISDNMKYFVFEGPVFVDKEKKKKDKKGEEKKGEEKKEELKVPDGGAGGGLLGGLLSAKAAKEKEEEEKAKREKAKKDKILYVFKLETSLSGFLTKKCTWKFVEYEMKLDWIANPATRHRTRQTIDHLGVFC